MRDNLKPRLGNGLSDVDLGPGAGGADGGFRGPRQLAAAEEEGPEEVYEA